MRFLDEILKIQFINYVQSEIVEYTREDLLPDKKFTIILFSFKAYNVSYEDQIKPEFMVNQSSVNLGNSVFGVPKSIIPTFNLSFVVPSETPAEAFSNYNAIVKLRDQIVTRSKPKVDDKTTVQEYGIPVPDPASLGSLEGAGFGIRFPPLSGLVDYLPFMFTSFSYKIIDDFGYFLYNGSDYPTKTVVGETVVPKAFTINLTGIVDASTLLSNRTDKTLTLKNRSQNFETGFREGSTYKELTTEQQANLKAAKKRATAAQASRQRALEVSRRVLGKK